MKTYSLTYKAYGKSWECVRFQATCDTDARFIARMIYRRRFVNYDCGFTLTDFHGKYIDL